MHYLNFTKNVLLKTEECEIQIDGYDCFLNINNFNCRRGVAIYTKRYLNARSYLKKLKSLYIFCVYINYQTAHLKIITFLIVDPKYFLEWWKITDIGGF